MLDSHWEGNCYQESSNLKVEPYNNGLSLGEDRVHKATREQILCLSVG